MAAQKAGRYRMRVAVAAATALACTGGLATIALGAAGAGASTNSSGLATYVVWKNGSIHGPTSLPTGPVILTIKGAKGQELQIFKPNPNVYAPKLQRDSANFNRTYIPTALEHDGRFVGGVETGHELQVFLPTGRYYFVGDGAMTKTKNVQVTSTVSTAHRPAAKQLKAVGMMSFAKTPKSIPASGWLKYTNTASDTHFLELDRLKPGKTDKDVAAALAGKEKESAVTYSGAGDEFDLGVVSPNWGEVVSYKLKPGTYAMLCFWPNKNGVPHAFLGMHRTIKVG